MSHWEVILLILSRFIDSSSSIIDIYTCVLKRISLVAAIIAISHFLVGCGGGGSDSGAGEQGSLGLTVEVSGLASGQSVKIFEVNGNSIVVTANGRYTLRDRMTPGSSYQLVVNTQPEKQFCSWDNKSSNKINTISTSLTEKLNCIDTYSIGGSASGLSSGEKILLTLNAPGDLGASQSVWVSDNGSFSFPERVGAVSAYYANILNYDIPGKDCVLSNSSGSNVTADVSNLSLNCSPAEYSVWVHVEGLAESYAVTLLLDGANPLEITSSAGPVPTFSKKLPYNGSYAVTIAQQPSSGVCTVNSGTGAGVNNHVHVYLVCSTYTYPVSGTITGLFPGQQLSIYNSSEVLSITQNGGFSFATPISYGGSYWVSIFNQPKNQTCAVRDGRNDRVTAEIPPVTIECSSANFSLGGTLSGLRAGRQVTLVNDSDSAFTPLTVNGVFQLSSKVAANGSYRVSVATQPPGQYCTVTGGTGSAINQDVSDIKVECKDTVSVSGSIVGLGSVPGLTLMLGTEKLNVSSNSTSFKFSQGLAGGQAYQVQVVGQPKASTSTSSTDLTCTVIDGQGTVADTDITNVVVNCGGTVQLFVGASQWKVPPGVTRLVALTAVGAGGGASGAFGGSGAAITIENLTVVPGQTLKFVIGRGGLEAKGGTESTVTLPGSSSPFLIAGAGGGSGKSSGFCTAGSGGNADIGTPTADSGKGGRYNILSVNDYISGGLGGRDGTPGPGGPRSFGSPGIDGLTGAARLGGAGGGGIGGRGGGGHGGGGGGAAASGGAGYSGGGGGGGGSLIPSGATATLAGNGGSAFGNGGDGSVVVRY